MIGTLILLSFLLGVGGLVYFIAWLRAKEAVSAWTTRAIASPFFRIGLLGGIVLISQVPMFFVEGILDERINYASSVQRQLENDAGGEQELKGPYLVVPYIFTDERREMLVNTVDGTPIRDNEGKVQYKLVEFENQAEAVFWPEDFTVNGEIIDVEKARSIYTALTYQSDFDISATFAPLDFENVGNKFLRLAEDPSYLTFSLSNPASIQGQVTAMVNSAEPMPFESGSPLFTKGAKFGVTLNGTALVQPTKTQMKLSFTGAQSLTILPIGKSNEITLQSRWPHPKFFGSSPGHSDIGDDGFVATWKPGVMASTYQKARKRSEMDSGAYGKQIGVGLFDRFGTYGLIDRAIKYALMIIGLTMATIFVIDQSSKRRMHPLQYLVVGGGLGIFYLLLLSVSEVLGFATAFMIAAGALSVTIGGYIASALRSIPRGVLVGLSLGGLYALLYTLLNLEDFALLVGSGLLFLVLIVIMMVTRNMGSAKAA